jgi:serine/threonine-protein kinase
VAIQIGDILGDYQVTGVLGRGGMGKVFRVRNLLTEREEAMKVVLAGLEEDRAFMDRFLREIKVHASLQHPNIAALYSAQRIGERLVMLLELVEGVSLEEKLRPEGMPAAESAHYISQALAALDFAHRHGVIHRDIKPANILIGAGGMVKLTDFGIARSTSAARLTGAGLAVGTLAYMSPEQITAGEADARSDIYSLGLTYYEMVTGRRPIHGDTEHALMTAQINVVPTEPSLVNPQVTAAISSVIMRALAKNAAHRFQSAQEFRSAVESAAAAKDAERGPYFEAPPPKGGILAAELAEVERRLSRFLGPIARRMVVDAASRYHTVSEIRQALAAQIENPKDREAFLHGVSQRPAFTDSAPTATMMQSSPAASEGDRASFDRVSLDRLSQALAPYLGPIAKMVVARAAKSARSMEELRCAAAAEIDSSADRARFLESTRSII